MNDDLKTIHVLTHDGAVAAYRGTGWMVDDSGHLHVFGAKGTGNVATYRCGAWDAVSVAQIEEAVERAIEKGMSAALAAAESQQRAARKVASR